MFAYLKSAYDEVYLFNYWEDPMGTKGLVMERLAVTADQAQMDVVGDEGNNSRPIELPMNVPNHFGDAWVASKAVVMAGGKDVQLGVLMVRNIE